MPTITTSITLDSKRCILSVPRGSTAEGRATSITCPVGAAPTRAWVLLNRTDAYALGAGPLTLQWQQVTTGGGTVTNNFQGLYPLTCERVGFGGVGDTNGVFLVGLVCGRYTAALASDAGLVAANCRSYAMDNNEDGARSFLENTEGVTWQSLASALWGACGTLGAFPGLPYAPDWRPEGQRFIGGNAFKSLCALLDFLDCAIVHNPLANAFSIVQLGAEQNVPAHTTELKWDSEARTFSTGLPGSVTAYYPTHYLAYGQERDTERDGNWSVEDAPDEGFRYATAGGAVAVPGAPGSLPRWQDLPRLIDKDLNDINGGRRAARTTAVGTRAALRYGVQRRHKIFYGLVNDVLPGAQVRSVQWRHLSESAGTETEYISGPHLPRDTGGKVGDLSATIEDLQPTENYAGHDLARHTTPTYPRLPNIVQVYTGGTPGTPVDPNGEGFHIGRVKRWVGGQMRTLEDCAILFVDDFDNKQGNVKAIEGEYYGPARLSGLASVDGQDLPLYLVRRGGEDFVFFELDGDLDLGSFQDAFVLVGDGADGWTVSNTAIVVQDPYNTPGMWQGFSGYRGFAKKHPTGDRYDIIWMERIAQWIYYELVTDMDFTAFPLLTISGTADVLDYHDQGKDPGEQVVVYHPDAYFLAWHVEGCRGWAHWNDRTKRYEITTPQLLCMFVRGRLKYNLCGTSEFPQEIEQIENIIQGYYSYPHPDGAEDLIAFENFHNHHAQAGNLVRLMAYDENYVLKFEIVQTTLIEVNVLTGLGRSGCSITADAKKIYVETCGTDGEQGSVTFDSIDVVKSAGFVSGTETIDGVPTPYCRYVVTTQPVCLLLNGDEVDTPFNLTAQDFVSDVFINSTPKLDQEKVPTFVICVGTAYEDEIGGTECP